MKLLYFYATLALAALRPPLGNYQQFKQSLELYGMNNFDLAVCTIWTPMIAGCFYDYPKILFCMLTIMATLFGALLRSATLHRADIMANLDLFGYSMDRKRIRLLRRFSQSEIRFAFKSMFMAFPLPYMVAYRLCIVLLSKLFPFTWIRKILAFFDLLSLVERHQQDYFTHRFLPCAPPQ